MRGCTARLPRHDGERLRKRRAQTPIAVSPFAFRLTLH